MISNFRKGNLETKYNDNKKRRMSLLKNNNEIYSIIISYNVPFSAVGYMNPLLPLISVLSS